MSEAGRILVAISEESGEWVTRVYLAEGGDTALMAAFRGSLGFCHRARALVPVFLFLVAERRRGLSEGLVEVL